jgi:NitT/TauT family transport system ATP-binding protein
VLTAGPERMADYFSIDLPAGRDLDIKTTEAFGIYVKWIYAQLGMH